MEVPNITKTQLYIYGGVLAIIVIVIAYYKFRKPETKPLTQNPTIKATVPPTQGGGIVEGIRGAIYGEGYEQLKEAQKVIKGSDLFKSNGILKAKLNRDKDAMFNEAAEYLNDELTSINIDQDGVINSLEGFVNDQWAAFNLLYLSDLYFRKYGKSLANALTDTTFMTADFGLNEGPALYALIQKALKSKSATDLRKLGIIL